MRQGCDCFDWIANNDQWKRTNTSPLQEIGPEAGEPRNTRIMDNGQWLLVERLVKESIQLFFELVGRTRLQPIRIEGRPIAPVRSRGLEETIMSSGKTSGLTRSGEFARKPRARQRCSMPFKNLAKQRGAASERSEYKDRRSRL